MSSSNPQSDGLGASDHARRVVWDVFGGGKSILFAIWKTTNRRVRATGALILFMFGTVSLWRHSYSQFGTSTFSSHRSSPFNESKVALLIENRPFPMLAPLVLHFMGVVPPDWRFKFMGSNESVASISESLAIRNQVAAGKLDIVHIPSNVSTDGQEMISRFLTNPWLYRTLLRPAEWLLVFQTDSILCANARQSINNWLEYDWVGAPWNPGGTWGGNGGLSLRRVSSILYILEHATREEEGGPEDVWLAERLAARPNARMANGTASLTFSGEMFSGELEDLDNPSNPSSDQSIDPTYIKGVDDWRQGGYEPMGYHTGAGGTTLHSGIWGRPEMRKHIWDYCPEVKMIFAMDAAEYVPGNCNDKWKRDGGSTGDGFVFDENNVDDNGYPYLPPNLKAW